MSNTKNLWPPSQSPVLTARSLHQVVVIVASAAVVVVDACDVADPLVFHLPLAVHLLYRPFIFSGIRQ